MNSPTQKKAILALEDGTIFSGLSDCAEGVSCGEVIFTTSMGGYQEVCTDPSYAHQIVVFTRPHIGNTGTNDDDNESSQCWVKGLVLKEASKTDSNWRSTNSFQSFLNTDNIPSLYNVDTRRLTNHLRERGSQHGCIAIGDASPQAAIQFAQESARTSHHDLSALVSTKTPYSWNHGLSSLLDIQPSPISSFSVCVIDFGVKHSILRWLVSLGCKVTVVPQSTTYNELLSHCPDGVLLSNGPGDPQKAYKAMNTIQKLLENNVPVFGVCFGCQLLGLAAGSTTVKMKVGHHGANHPVSDLAHNTTFITSQNHDFVISDDGRHHAFEITHRSLVDGSIEGIKLNNHTAFGFQGHPEGSPGPFDISGLFHEFTHVMRTHAKKPIA